MKLSKNVFLLCFDLGEKTKVKVVLRPSCGVSKEPPLQRMTTPFAAMTQVETYRTNTNYLNLAYKLKMKD
jgi:hypothetical protein